MSDWREEPATDRQREYAEVLGVTIPPGATKGEASDLISEAKELGKETNETIRLVIGDERSAVSKFLEGTGNIISIIIWMGSIIILFTGIILYAIGKVFYSVIAIFIGGVIIYVMIRRKNKRSGIRYYDGGKPNYEPEPVHALPGTFDESYFRNPKTGKFQFPKYKHDKRFLIKITDETDYRSDYWEDLDAEERREYSLRDFEDSFYGPDLEVEPIETLFYKPTSDHLKPLEYLKGHWSVVEKLLSSDEDVWITVDPDSKPMKILLKEGYLFEQVVVTDEDKLAYYRLFKVPELMEACKKANFTPGKKKQETIDRMIASNKPFDLPPVVVRAPKLDEWLKSIVDLYIKDIQQNANRFHPLYIFHILDAVKESNEIAMIDDAVDKIIETKYWLKRLVI